MGKFRKYPIEIEATQWFANGDHPDDGPSNQEGEVVRRFCRLDISGSKPCSHCEIIMRRHGWIATLEGGHIVCPGDWIITGVEGERYPCKPKIFVATYEAVS